MISVSRLAILSSPFRSFKETPTDQLSVVCFDGGNFILGDLVLDRQEYIDFGLELARSCHETYTATATGIGPEAFA